MKLKLFFIAFTLLGFFWTHAQSTDEIISKYIIKIGGAEKWKALKSIKSAGKVNIQGMDIFLTTYEKPKTMKRMDMKGTGVEVIQAYDGKEGWMFSPSMGKDPIKLNEEQSKQLTEDEFENKFIDYKKKGHEITFLGTEELDGIKCFKLQLIKNKNKEKPDNKEIFYFDAETFLPVLELGYKTKEGKTFEMKNYIGDYHEVDGLMFPFYEETKIDGQSFQKITFEKITLNEPMEDSFFSFPKK